MKGFVKGDVCFVTKDFMFTLSKGYNKKGKFKGYFTFVLKKGTKVVLTGDFIKSVNKVGAYLPIEKKGIIMFVFRYIPISILNPSGRNLPIRCFTSRTVLNNPLDPDFEERK